ncbi:MAG: PadR family transcriptional regulator [Desulfomonilaceae bacterium]
MTSSARTKRGNAALNPACFPVLAIVADGPIHGYDISRTLRSEIGQLWRLGKSQVYALLVKLEKAGLVQHERIGQDAYPAKNVFTITETGKMVLNDWATQPVRHIRDMRLEFPVKLWFARKMGNHQKEQLIQSQLEICHKKLERLEALKASEQRCVVKQTLELRLAMVRGVGAWLVSLLTPSGDCHRVIPEDASGNGVRSKNYCETEIAKEGVC